jgi:alpha-D-ribose 1-methylphosphonate 5-triphosphate synthase subunit PhnL
MTTTMAPVGEPVIRVEGLAKTFVLHNQGGARLPVFDGVALCVRPGECVVLSGVSGTGKSTLMRALYGNYGADAGRILVRHDEAWVDMVSVPPRRVIAVRRRTVGYVSQFLRVIPRIATLDIVMEPMLAAGVAPAEASRRARALLARLALPEALWALPPATFSGGEQQRVNLARGFAMDYPILLLDEPTASLDDANRRTVVALIGEARARGVAIVGIFHDSVVRDAVATRIFDVTRFKDAA